MARCTAAVALTLAACVLHAPLSAQDADDERHATSPDDQSALQRSIGELGTARPSATPTAPPPKPVASHPAPSPSATPQAAATPEAEPGTTPAAGETETAASPAETPEASEPAASETEAVAEDAGDTEGTSPLTWALIGLIALVLAVAAGFFVGKGSDDGPEPQDSTPDPELTIPDDDPPPHAPEDPWIPVDDDTQITHHCRGHRLGIVVGPAENPPIKMARDWLKKNEKVQHKLFIEVELPTTDPRSNNKNPGTQPDFGKLYSDEPGNKTPGTPLNATNDPATMRQSIDTYLSDHCQCCCHWDEVIIFMHGETRNVWYWLLKNLTKLLGDRPLYKFVLWMCSSAEDFYPDHGIPIYGQDDADKPAKLGSEAGKRPEPHPYVKVFEQIAWILRPKSCHQEDHCGCPVGKCVAYDADRSNKVHPVCPDGKQEVELMCSAWVTKKYPGEGVRTTGDVSAVVGIGPDPDIPREAKLKDTFFTSPDGGVRSVKIKSDGHGGYEVSSTKLPSCDDVFAGTPLRARRPPNKPEVPRDVDDLEELDEHDVVAVKTRVKKTKAQKPSEVAEPAAYSGGKYKKPKGCQLGDKPIRPI